MPHLELGARHVANMVSFGDRLELGSHMLFLRRCQALMHLVGRAMAQELRIRPDDVLELHGRLKAVDRPDRIQCWPQVRMGHHVPRAILLEDSVRRTDDEADGVALIVVGVTDRGA